MFGFGRGRVVGLLFTASVCAWVWGYSSLLPRVRKLPDLLTHRTGTPSWSDGGVWLSCVFTACAMVRSKKVQVLARLCVSARTRELLLKG